MVSVVRYGIGAISAKIREEAEVNLKKLRPESVLKGSLLLAAFVSFVISVSLYFGAGAEIPKRLNGIYVGIWVPSILSLGSFILAGTKRPRD